ncbi:hypothetical protein LKMONMHP_0623 [Methylobacterium organophilum]|uniref:Uncharacterized protein n=1 Tax=Methylobacterium organophilum TaxID=410 RepID=A0ABQ4T2N2_METOR|nr:hypothetical protein LKMONMHP_0623 [Methylobacterium organophilum]
MSQIYWRKFHYMRQLYKYTKKFFVTAIVARNEDPTIVGIVEFAAGAHFFHHGEGILEGSLGVVDFNTDFVANDFAMTL